MNTGQTTEAQTEIKKKSVTFNSLLDATRCCVEHESKQK